MNGTEIMRELPEIAQIENEDLREKTLMTYEAATKRGGWSSLHDIPFTLLIPGLDRDYVDHVRRVTSSARAVAATRDDLDMDIVTAGALLHDVGKLLEYEPVVPVVKSDFGKLVRHPVSGAALAMEFDLPDEIVHLIAAHSKEGEAVSRTAEAILIHHCDFIDFEIEKTKH